MVLEDVMDTFGAYDDTALPMPELRGSVDGGAVGDWRAVPADHANQNRNSLHLFKIGRKNKAIITILRLARVCTPSAFARAPSRPSARSCYSPS